MVSGGIIQPAPKKELARFGQRTTAPLAPRAPQKQAPQAEPGAVYPTYEKDGVTYYDLDRIYKDSDLRAVFERQYPQSKDYFASLDKPETAAPAAPAVTTEQRYQQREPTQKELRRLMMQLSPAEQLRRLMMQLSPAEQMKLQSMGYDAYIKARDALISKSQRDASLLMQQQFKSEYIELDTGEYVNRSEFSLLPVEAQEVLKTQGVDAYNKFAAAQAETQMAQQKAEYDAYIKSLPQTTQDYIAQYGVEGYNQFVEQEQARTQTVLDKLAPYITTTPDGKQSVDIVGAFQGTDVTYADLKQIGISQDQIAQAYLAEPGFNTVPMTYVYTTQVGDELFSLDVPQAPGQAPKPPDKLFAEMQQLGVIPADATFVGGRDSTVEYSLPAQKKAPETIIAPGKTIFTAEMEDDLNPYIRGSGYDLAAYLRDQPDNAAVLASYNFKPEDIQAAQTYNVILAETVAVQPPETFWQKLSPIWQGITPWDEAGGETFISYAKGFPGRAFETLKENLTGSAFTRYQTPEMQAELKAEYDRQTGDWFMLQLLPSGKYPFGVYYDEEKDLYLPIQGGFVPVSKSAKVVDLKTSKLLDAADIGMSEAKFKDFLRARIEIPNLTPEQFDKLDDLKLSQLLAKSRAAMTDMEVWLRSKDYNKAWNEIVLRRLMEQVVAKQQATNKMATLARELKETGQITLITPQLSTAPKVDTTAIVLTTGQAVAKVAQNINKLMAGEKLTPQEAQQVAISLQTDLALDEKTAAAVQNWVKTGQAPDTAIRTKLAAAIQTRYNAYPELAPITKLQPVAQPLTRPVPSPQMQAFGGVMPATLTSTYTMPQTLTMATTTQPATSVKPQPVLQPTITAPQPKPQLAPQPQPVKQPTAQKTQAPNIKSPRMRPPQPLKPPLKPELPTLEMSMKEKRKAFKNAIVWKQGFGWWAIKEPYASQGDVAFFYKTPPPGARVVKGGAQSAARSIQALTGNSPVRLLLDMGIMDVIINSPGKQPGASGAIKFVPDRKQNTNAGLDLKGDGMEIRPLPQITAVPMQAAPPPPKKRKAKAHKKKSTVSKLVSQIIGV